MGTGEMVGFLRRLWQRGRPVLDVLGVVATLFVVYQAISYFFFEGKSISAVYRVSILAQEGKIFNLKSVLKPEFADARNVAEVSVLIWNSGKQEIESKDVRQDVTIKLAKNSNILAVQQGLQHSNKAEDFRFAGVENATYSLRWDVLDPGDYFEVNFLLASNFDKASLQQSVEIDGLIAGNIKVGTHGLDQVGAWRNVTIELSIVFLLVGWLIVTPIIIDRSERMKRGFNAMSARIGVPIVISYVVLVFVVAIIVGSIIGNYLVRIPVWLEPSYFPPHIYLESQ